MEKPGARLRKEKILETCLLCLYLHNPIFRLIQSLALNFTGVIYIYIYIYLFVFWRNKIFKNWKRYIRIIGEIDNWHEFNKEKLKKLLKMRRVEWNFRNDWTKPTKLTKREGEREREEKRTKIQAMITGQGWQNGIKRIRGEGRAWLPLSADPADSSTTFCSVANCRHE